MNRVNNDDVHQGLEIVSSDKDIHSLSNVVREKVGDLYFKHVFHIQNNSCNDNLKCIMGCYTFTLTRALK